MGAEQPQNVVTEWVPIALETKPLNVSKVFETQVADRLEELIDAAVEAFLDDLHKRLDLVPRGKVHRPDRQQRGQPISVNQLVLRHESEEPSQQPLRTPK